MNKVISHTLYDEYKSLELQPTKFGVYVTTYNDGRYISVLLNRRQLQNLQDTIEEILQELEPATLDGK